MTTENFNAYSKYYDLLYKDKDYAREAGYVAGLIAVEKPAAGTILELGCGTGNHATILCEQGYRVTGIERSAEMVALAKHKNIQGFHPLVGDITGFALNEQFDVAVSLFHVISYLVNNKDLVACFKAVSEHLNNGGIFIFDVWYSPAVYIQKPETRVKRMQDSDIEVTRIAESVMHYNSNVVDVHYEILIRDKASKKMDVFKEKHPMRHFSIPEIELLASLTGFSLLKSEEFVTKKTPGADTWGVCFVLQKI